MKKLKGKIAVVTGGSRGIGAAIAKRLAQDGAQVILTYTSSPEKASAVVQEIEKEGGKAKSFKCDQSKSDDIKKLIQDVSKEFGSLDILVNNAGVYVGGAINDAKRDEKAFAYQQAVNVNGVVTTVHEAVKVMKQEGRIVLIGSVNGQKTSSKESADYSATKAALQGYTRGWARDLGSKNITVNIVQPGPIDTDMNPADSERAKTILPSLALGRYGKAEEVAAAVAFLVSPEASYITGISLNVDGGFLA